MAELTLGILGAGPAKWSSSLSGAHTVYLHTFKTTPWRRTIAWVKPKGNEQPCSSPGEDSRCSGEWQQCHPTLLLTPCLITPVQILSYVSALQAGQWSELTLTYGDSSRCDGILLMWRWWPLSCIVPPLNSRQRKHLKQYDSPPRFNAYIYLVLKGWVGIVCVVGIWIICLPTPEHCWGLFFAVKKTFAGIYRLYLPRKSLVSRFNSMFFFILYFIFAL